MNSQITYLIFSDSHGALDSVLEVVERCISEIDGILFLGDGAEELVELSYLYPNLKYYGVTGNNDYREQGNGICFPLEELIEIKNVKIYLTHGHIAPYSQVQNSVRERAKSQGAAIAFYGHLHRPYYENREGLLLASPGSIAYPRGGSEPSYLLLTIDGESDRVILNYRHAFNHNQLNKYEAYI